MKIKLYNNTKQTIRTTVLVFDDFLQLSSILSH